MESTEEKTLTRATISIRAFQPEDYPGITELYRRVEPDYPSTEAEVREEDERVDREKYVQVRYIGEDPASREVVGVAEYNHMMWSFDPGRFALWIGVAPDRRGMGIGSALYEHLLQDFGARHVTALRVWAREDRANAIAFVEHRGFRELERAWESRLDLTAFEGSRFADRAAIPSGMRIVTLAEELARDPEALRAVYEFDALVSRDVPRLDPQTTPEYEEWRKGLMGRAFLPEAWFFAKEGDAIVGQSNFWKSEAAPDHIHTGFTGVRREYRGRGLAWALKLRALMWAKERGYRQVRTWNSTRNAPMLGINVALGFVKQPAWVTFAKDLTEGRA